MVIVSLFASANLLICLIFLLSNLLEQTGLGERIHLKYAEVDFM